MANEMSMENKSLGLAGIPLFRELSPTALVKISGLMIHVSFKAGDTIFLEREPGDALYVVDSGGVRVWVRDTDANEVTLSELGPGDFFGEMSLLDGGRRCDSATAVVVTTLYSFARASIPTFV